MMQDTDMRDATAVETVGDLIQRLEEYPEDAEIRVAYQPSWPLRAHLARVVSDAEARDYDGDDDEGPEEFVVWLVASDSVSSSENPYAPRAVFGGGD